MTVVVCVDERGGMMFGGKRQSRDRVLRARIAGKTKEKNLIVSPYSAAQFEGERDLTVSDTPFEAAGAEDFVFVEDKDMTAHIGIIDSFIIYKWNRLYPSDAPFPFDLESAGFRLVSSEDFKGSSHERITEEVYVR